MGRKVLRVCAIFVVMLTSALALGACKGKTDSSLDTSTGGASVDEAIYHNGSLPFKVSSNAVANGVLADEYGMHADQSYEFDVAATSPPLEISNIPEGTVAYAIIMEDPDSLEVAGYVWDHWLAANITETSVPAGASIEQYGEMVQGMNSFSTVGYGGPKPPSGTHTYVIHVYALSQMLELENGFSRAELEAAIKAPGVMLDRAELYAAFSAESPA